MSVKTTRIIAAATAAAIALTAVNLVPASAAPVSSKPSVAKAGGLEISARRRNHHANRAVLGAVLGLFGTVAALAARDRYGRYHYYTGYGPYYGPYPAPRYVYPYPYRYRW
jgi:hypothetical protein